MKILVTGGTGLIGKVLCQKLREKGHTVNILSRSENVAKNQFVWEIHKGYIDPKALEGIDGIFHLAGSPVSKRWTKSYKKEMYESRVTSLQLIENKLLEMGSSLEFLISSSGVNYYGTETTSNIYTENDPAGDDYLAQLCVAWEKANEEFKVPTNQKAILRTAVVLDPNGGALQKMLPTFKMGMGAVLGSGNQVMPSISLSDLVEMYIYTMEQKLNGVYNAAGFNITQKEFAKQLATKLHKPLFLKVPAFALQIALGEMSSIVLKGSAVSNDKIKSTGFQFQNSDFESIKN